MNFAIVGCGFIAKKHAVVINNLKEARLVAVCDRIPELMESYVKDYGVTTYAKLEEMLQDDSIDVVNICTPSGTHAVIAELAAKHGKHIIIEKPIALTLEDSDRIINAAKENNVKLSVVHPNRFRPVVIKMMEILDQKLLGNISHALCIVNWNRGQEYYDQSPWRGTKEHDGGVLMNQAIHNIDLLLTFMGKPIEVFSMVATRLRNIEADDVSTGIVRFESGALATIQASTTVYPKNFEESITIFGEKGTVKIGGSNALYLEHIIIEGIDEETTEKWKNSIIADPWGITGHEQIIKDTIYAIKENRQPIVTGVDGRNALSLVLSFYESASNKKIVRLIVKE